MFGRIRVLIFLSFLLVVLFVKLVLLLVVILVRVMCCLLIMLFVNWKMLRSNCLVLSCISVGILIFMVMLLCFLIISGSVRVVI